MSRQIGERVVLREFQWTDLADIREWVLDPAITKYLSSTFMKPQTSEQTENFLRNMLEGGSGANFVIARKEDLSYLGQCNLMMPDFIARKAELAVVLKGKHIGQGYGREALSLLIDFGFDQMNLNRIYLKANEPNFRAVHLYESLGFRVEGRLREDTYLDGQYVDLLVMGLLRDEWLCNRRAPGFVQA